MAKKRGKTEEDFAWENRVLCADGNCIGVIGTDGVCKECGKPLDPTQEKAQSHDDPETEADAPAQSTGSPEEGEEITESEVKADEPGETETDDDWENRTLCSDEGCIGIIGTDGLCKECSQPYQQT
ncbi:MAG: hypothetical protein V3S89_13060 [Desulfobacterales bacterium]